jgi:hypothetical protein
MIFSGEYRWRFILTSFCVSRSYQIPNLKSGSVFGGQVTGTRLFVIYRNKLNGGGVTVTMGFQIFEIRVQVLALKVNNFPD